MKTRMTSLLLLIVALYCLLELPVSVDATALSKIIKPKDGVGIDTTKANGFLSSSRPRRSLDPRWHRNSPDFQSFYRYYNSIGHVEGLYEIDRIRMLYQQMRHLEQVYGPDASSYQNILGVQPKVTAPPTTAAPTTPAPTTTQPPLPTLSSDVIYLCHHKDPLCKPHVVYLPTGGIPVLCDPRHNPECKPSVVEAIAVPPMPAVSKVPQIPAAPLEPKNSDPPPTPPALIFKGLEYDCDPYWDPDCLIDHPPRAIVEKPQTPSVEEVSPSKEKLGEEGEKKEVKEDKAAPPAPPANGKVDHPYPYLDPFDYRSELFDPYIYSQPAPEPGAASDDQESE
ncbi:actinodin3 [Denticeps clupeoides]|uniref:actinodin3 n=1 Tax=Denticeps clupeoides TaxID=299321 RepID=UPI0010A48065|nr:vegetative cell wall protein gp1-like [Denticeps clupeoides]